MNAAMYGKAAEAVSVDVGKLLGDAGMTVLIGVTVVFSVLILLTVLFWLFGVVMSGSRGEKKKATPPAAAPAQPKVAAPAPMPTVAKAPAVQSGIPEEVVAVIAAAVAAMSTDGKRYAVRSVSRARGERPVWASAGLAENTRPF